MKIDNTQENSNKGHVERERPTDRKRENCHPHNNRIQQTGSKGIQEQAWLGRKSEILGIVQETEV